MKDNFDLRKYLTEGRLFEEKTDWSNLDPDFSDSAEISFQNGDTSFQVNIKQFKQKFNGKIVDTEGKERSIDKKIFDDILESYLENFPEDKK